MDGHAIEAKQTVLASRKLGRNDAASLARAATRVIVAKGKNVQEFSPGGRAPKQVVDAMLGPTGNLRAPTLRVGKTIVVGFNEDSYRSVLL